MEKKYFEGETIVGESFFEEKRDKYEYLECIFRKCDFSYAAFPDCRFVDCIFENCNFSMTQMDKCVHNNSRFLHCKIQGVLFDRCSSNIFNIGFASSFISYTAFNGKKMPKTLFKQCELKSVDFSACDLAGSRFEMCAMPDCVFNETNLNGVDFSTASQYKIDPEKNSLKGARFDILGLAGLLEKYGIEIV